MARLKLSALFCGSAVAALGGGAAWADAPAQAAPSALQEVVVTARRTAENMQTVPVAVSVVTQRTFDAKGAFRPEDLRENVPGLNIAASVSDRQNLTFSIRGQSYAYGTLFQSVLTYFNEVPVTQVTVGQFFDLQNVQVLRGPQGVLFGRVTDGGNVMVSPKRPGNQIDGYVEVKVGDYSLNDYAGALNVPLIADKLMVRGAFEIDRRGGFTTNIYNGQKVDDVASEGYRLGVLFRPVERFENYTVVQYQHTHDHGTGMQIQAINPGTVDPLFTPPKLGGFLGSTGGTFGLLGSAYGIDSVGNIVPFRPGLTPLTAANALASQQAQIARQKALGPRQIYQTSPLFDRRTNLYVVNTTTFDITSNIQFKNIFGYTRVTDFESSNFTGSNGQIIETCHSECGIFTGYPSSPLPFNSQAQFSDEVRITGKSFNDRLSWSLGSYFDYQHPAEAFQNMTVNVGILQRDGVSYSTTREKAGSGWVEYDASDFVKGLKFNGGIRYTNDTVVNTQNTYVQPIFSPLLTPAGLPAYFGFLQTAAGGG
ncbi:MAG: TonB-dependent receptor plug domain-containing protein [Caulobacteraceae bacterium]|nr:TonB-dependent receptor plug domain-containing protein [Caulobacteraceae bacterium]